ncbi:NPCBM/NEW2 domain-containing protein [Nonomuraea cypriaca]
MGRDKNIGGNPIKIAGRTYAKGLAPHAASEVTYYLGRSCTRFTTDVGIDDARRDRAGHGCDAPAALPRAGSYRGLLPRRPSSRRAPYWRDPGRSRPSPCPRPAPST